MRQGQAGLGFPLDLSLAFALGATAGSAAAWPMFLLVRVWALSFHLARSIAEMESTRNLAGIVFPFTFTLAFRLCFRLGLRSWGGLLAVGVLAILSMVAFTFLKIFAHKVTCILALASAFILPFLFRGRSGWTAAYGV